MVISPGLEEVIKSVTRVKDKVNVIVYADDFIVSATSEDVLVSKVKPTIERFLLERGLSLSEKKTHITHIDKGFDFLGANIRKYKGKLIIRPSEKNVKMFLNNIGNQIKVMRASKTEHLIRTLNRKIQGWANFHRHICAKKTFVRVDHEITMKLIRWARRRHPNKSAQWVWSKYFSGPGCNSGQLSTKVGKEDKLLKLTLATRTPIIRHIKFRAKMNPYKDEFGKYVMKLKDMREFRKKSKAGSDNNQAL